MPVVEIDIQAHEVEKRLGIPDETLLIHPSTINGDLVYIQYARAG
jgi:hypothetical protein